MKNEKFYLIINLIILIFIHLLNFSNTIFFQSFNCLSSNNIVIISTNKIEKYNPESKNISTIFDHNSHFLNYYDDFKFISFSQLLIEEEEYIFCRIKKHLYVLDKSLSNYKDIEIHEIEAQNVDLIPYKNNDGNIMIFIVYLAENPLKIKLLSYKINNGSSEINIVKLNETFISIIPNHDIYHCNPIISCQLIPQSNNSNKLLICFVLVKNEYMISVTIEPENDFKFLFNSINNITVTLASIFQSILSPDGKKILICIICEHNLSCLIYDNEKRMFGSLVPLFGGCKNTEGSMNMKYINGEYFLYCYCDDGQINSIKLDNYFNIKDKKSNGSKCYTNLKPNSSWTDELPNIIHLNESNTYGIMFYKENTLTILNISENCNSLIEAIGLGIFNESEDKIYQLESSIISDPIDILDSIPSKNETSVLESSIIFEPTNNNIGQTTILEVTENLQSNTNTETTIVIKSTNPIIVPSSIVSSTILSSNIISDSLFLGKIEEERIYIKKENLFDEIPYILETIEIEKINKKIGDDFSILIYPTNSNFDSGTTHIIFSECESILREHYKIPNSTITFFQIEIENNNSKSLINQVEYQAYEGKKPLNLSLCNDTSIEILYAIKNNSLVNFNSVNQFMKSGIDIFNINDSFFNDICEPYLNSNDDLILEDRIKYIYQNYSLCEEGCTYNKIILENMTISCQCKVKENISLVINPIEFEEVERSSTNFDVVKCYKLVFSLKGKLNNIGFLIFSILVISHIPLLIYFFNKGIKPIKNYVFNEMKKYGYIKDKNLKKSKNKKNHSAPPKNKNNNNQKKYIIKNLKIIDNSSSINILKSSKRGIIPRNNIANQLNNKDNKKNKGNNKNKQIKNFKKLKKNSIKAKNKLKKGTFIPNKIISNIETQNNYQNENKKNAKLKTFSFINIDLKLSRNRK